MGSLRPVSLLNCMGKWLEDLMITRLGVDIEAGDWLDDRQFGFRAGRGAEDAVNRLIDGARSVSGRYVVGLFLDISGAFDGARWSDMLERVNAISGCRHLVRLFEDYFADRHAQMTLNWGSFRKALDRGCPQGSKVGPLGWILLFDSFLRLPWPSRVQATAYADDAALIIGADTRKELEETAGVCCTLIEKWGAEHAQVFNAKKTEAIMLRLPRGTDPDKYRTLTVRLGGQSVKFKKAVRYLGVMLERGFTFSTHSRVVTQRAKAAYAGVARIVRADWGVSFRVGRLIYDAVVVSIVAYAASTFDHRVRENLRFAHSLRAAQRPALLALCKAYRTTSTAALCVLAGTLPLDYVVLERAAMYRLRHGTPVQWRGRDIQPGDGCAWKERTRQTLRECAIEEWDEEWRESGDGRLTYSFLPSVDSRMKMDWFVPSKFTTWMVTGHGPFRTYYERFRLRPAMACRCGEPRQTAEHILWVCSEADDLRRAALEGLRELNGGVVPVGGWSNPDWFSCREAHRLLAELRERLSCAARRTRSNEWGTDQRDPRWAGL